MSTGRGRTSLIIVLVSFAVFHQPITGKAVDLPMTGKPVSELAIFDQTMQDFMQDRMIGAGLLGIMKDGCIVYERGFGWTEVDLLEALPEDAMMRIASCGKPITAAAIHKLADMDAISLSDRVFDLTDEGLQPGILDYAPFPSLSDNRLNDITVQNLLDHQSGWDPEDDPTYEEVEIAEAMGVASPPGRIRTARYIMGMDLQVAPGTPDCISPGNPAGCHDGNQYSNAGYMMLGLIIEQGSGMDYIDFVRQHVFGPIPGELGTSVEPGRSYDEFQNPREPWYMSSTFVQDVFHPDGDPVLWPYGGWDHEARVAQGGLIAATEPMLRFMEHYSIDGTPIAGNLSTRMHTGSMPRGTRALTRWRSDGVNYVVLLNRKETSEFGGLCSDYTPCTEDADCAVGSCEWSWAVQISWFLDDVIDNAGVVWPTECVDGMWVDFNHSASGSGNFDDPFNTLAAGLASTPARGRLRIKGSTTSWTGTIGQRVELHATLGSAVIGR
jgi:CubicO group peptidase (beta-lactamase class C family)